MRVTRVGCSRALPVRVAARILAGEVGAMGRQVGDRAVVLGASMAGLLAARVLADAYGQVTVVDRDPLPEASAQRRGVPRDGTPTRCWRGGSRPWRSCSVGSRPS
jgi:threonine dehydrogenase-like Zn-dependent dehydrogenase